MHRPAFLSVLIATAFLLSSAAPVGAATPTEVAVSQAWVKASSYSDHVGGMTGVFGTITNKSKKNHHSRGRHLKFRACT
jgi:copper(I)-binding protein